MEFSKYVALTTLTVIAVHFVAKPVAGHSGRLGIVLLSCLTWLALFVMRNTIALAAYAAVVAGIAVLVDGLLLKSARRPNPVVMAGLLALWQIVGAFVLAFSACVITSDCT